MSINQQVSTHTIQAATATATGQPVNIKNASKVSFIFKRSAHGSGSTSFSVSVSIDGTNWAVYNRLLTNVANSNSETIVHAAAMALGSDTTEFASMSAEDAFVWVKVTATETTDGTHDAWVVVQYD